MKYLIQTKDNYSIIGLALQENHFLVLSKKHRLTYLKEPYSEGGIHVLEEGDTVVPFGPHEDYVSCLDDVWQSMDVVDKEWDKAKLEELFPYVANYWFLMKTNTGNYCVGGHIGPCNPKPFFYLKDPKDLSEFIKDVQVRTQEER